MKKPRNQHFAALVVESLFFLTLLAAYAKAEPSLFGIGSNTLGGRFVLV